MSLLVGTNLGKAFGALDVFGGVDLRIEAGDRIGFVGPNGAGKTTLLRILANVEPPTTGEVARKRGLTSGYLPQDPPPAGVATLCEAMLEVFADLRSQTAELAELERQMAHAAGQQDDHYETLLATYGQAQTAFEVAGGYTYETRIRQVLGGLGFNEDMHGIPLAHLSGGERTRALLAQLLLQEPDLLLLDEPTNHLDLEAVEWLEETLVHWKGALVIVAHDRYFLDKVATRIWEMNFGWLETYRGNYSAYHLQREMQRERQRREWEAQQEQIADTEEFIRRNLAGQRTREAQGRRTRLQRFLEEEAVERPQEDKHIRLGLTTQIRSGDLVLATKDLVVGYDEPLFACPDIEIRRGERVALIGPNGAGKTTLLKGILGQTPPLAGKIRIGASVHIGYLAQTQAGLRSDQTVLDTILDLKNLPIGQARNFLGQFLFSGDDVFRTIGTLSGGQRSRVALARLTLQGANFLLLDEPTNHLDLASQEILEDVLKRFPGTVLLVSHDRYLVQALATHIWRVDGRELRVYEGNYDEYLRQRAAESAPGNDAAATEAAERSAAIERNRERMREERRQRKVAEKLAEQTSALETQIHALETRLSALSTQLEAASVSGDVARVERLGVAYQTTESELHELMAQWAEMA
ncbi:MAG: ABC-F family ATP-binding cassette domain-containing protein [Chloroflexi bacterium]|nr:ABC-F family ATP-binding cassette domain-containing protein [Chloroflexota bacterium]